jgi:ABC-type dipeptide/oligopeptide/nickel transport system ATPase subunit
MIQVNNLHFTYGKTQKEAIQNMCFDVAEGEVFGFLRAKWRR